MGDATMLTVNIHEAKTQLSKLVEKVVAGEPVIIAKAGKPLVKVVPYDAPEKPNLFGCMRGLAVIDKDLNIKAIAHDEIISMFEGEE
jgi:prevent-host-death family protein